MKRNITIVLNNTEPNFHYSLKITLDIILKFW